MRFHTMQDAIDFMMHTRRTRLIKRGLDEHTRNIHHTRTLLTRTGLAYLQHRQYCVITGSKGKGSTAAITAKLLQSLGHSTGLITSPHLRYWNERIRANGHAIPDADFMRILDDLAPAIEEKIATLTDEQYISPQGILLMIALRWWDEQAVTAAVLEVGRGGRFDDMSLVPNQVSLFTPIFAEHTQYLGNLGRIAWHKAGIIKQGSFVYSVAQAPVVMEILQREADSSGSEFFWFSPLDMGTYLGDTENGIRFSLQRYGEIDLPFYGRYQIQNATLAVQAVGNMHGRLKGIEHSSPEYVERIRHGLETVRWQGRLQKLQSNPAVYVDGAINVHSAQDFLMSLGERLTHPIVTIMGVPQDRNVEDVYRVYAEASDALIITENNIHPYIHFPPEQEALALAQQMHADVSYRKILPDAVELALEKAGTEGTVLLGVAQPLVGEAMMIWDVDTRQI
ncbi:MAG: bifunctional folylpolyglutamate synthase/dihydrofolate synthase [Anaerolineae bacterium]